MLRETVQEWTQQWLEEGRQQGRQEGRQQGRQEGRQQGEAQLLTRLLERRFGTLAAADHARIQQADADELLTWGERLLTARTPEEVFGDSGE
jgi:predicted transposase YdaD